MPKYERLTDIRFSPSGMRVVFGIRDHLGGVSVCIFIVAEVIGDTPRLIPNPQGVELVRIVDDGVLKSWTSSYKLAHIDTQGLMALKYTNAFNNGDHQFIFGMLEDDYWNFKRSWEEEDY